MNLKINVFNMKGQKTKMLVNEIQSAGWHTVTWEGTDTNGDRVSSGIYFVQMEADGFMAVKQMVLTR
jgi:flagellar hook assembly protein FlgD